MRIGKFVIGAVLGFAAIAGTLELPRQASFAKESGYRTLVFEVVVVDKATNQVVFRRREKIHVASSDLAEFGRIAKKLLDDLQKRWPGLEIRVRLIAIE